MSNVFGEKKSILFYDHATIFTDGNGDYYVNSGIGILLNEIQKSFRVGLLLKPALKRERSHDFILKGDQFNHYSINIEKGRVNPLLAKIVNLEAIRVETQNSFDILMIRGYTPHQTLIQDAFGKTRRTVLLLVTALNFDVSIGSVGIGQYLAVKYRSRQFWRFLNSVDLVVCNNQGTRSRLKNKIKTKVVFISTNIVRDRDYSGFNFKPRSKKSLSLLFVGKIVESKGVTELLLGVKQIIKETHYSLTLTLAGDGDSIYRQTLNDLILKEDLQEFINFEGHLSFKNGLAEKYRNADLVVLPSYSEGFPRVFWEAASHSVPTVLSRVGGIPDMLVSGQDSILVEPKSIGSLKNGILKLLDSAELSRSIAQNAYAFAASNSLEKSILRLKKELDKL